MDNIFRKLTAFFLFTLLSIGCATPVGCNHETCWANIAPRESFVKVEVEQILGTSSGSGVVIAHINDENSIVLTAGHLCKGMIMDMEVLDLSENHYKYIAKIVAPEDDLCLLITDHLIPVKAIPIAAEMPDIGELVWNIAAPLGIHDRNLALVFYGNFQGSTIIPTEKYQVDLHSFPGRGGSSGSPVFNDKWEIIGIVSRGIPDFPNIMMSINRQRIELFLKTNITPELSEKIKAYSVLRKEVLK